MSVRGVELLRSLCRLLIRANADGTLRRGLNERDTAVREANDILALTKLKPSRPWSDNDELDHLVASLRRTASERRLGANVRAQALRRLAFIEFGTPPLGSEPTDDLIRALLAGKPQRAPEWTPPADETFEEKKQRLLAAHGIGG